MLLSLLAAAPVVDGASLSLDAELYEVGREIQLVVTGDPGDRAALLLSGSLADVTIPGLGTLGLSLSDGFFSVDLGTIPADGTLEATCDLGCNSPLLQEPCFLQAVTLDFTDPVEPFCVTNVVALEGVADGCDLCAGDPDVDPQVAVDTRDWGLDLGGLGTSERFRFTGGGEFAEFPNGTAVLSGIVEADDQADCRAYVEITFDARVGALEPGFPPAGSPVLGLDPSAYADAGGPVKVGSWHYYELASGSLVGLEGCLEGAELSLVIGGVATQVGRGANNANTRFGLESELIWNVEQQPDQGQLVASGIASLRTDSRDCEAGGDLLCPTTADADSDFCTGGDHAVWFKQLGKDWRFVGGFGDFVEFPDGTATLGGEIFNTDAPGERFLVDVLLSDRVAPGDAAYPPAGSPKLGLCDDLYADQGGPVDPDTFVYYTQTTGVLIGLGELEGAVLDITRKGPSFQVGEGANVKNPNFGLSGWFDYEVLAQPNSGAHLEHSNGDFNVDLVDCPEPVLPSAGPICAYDFEAQGGETVFDRVGDLDLGFEPGNGALEWVVDGEGTGVRFVQGSNGTARLWAGDGGQADGLLASLVSTGAFTVQVAAVVDEDSRDDARLVSFSDDTPVSARNFTLMGYPEGDDDIEAEFRVVTSSGAHREEVEVDSDVAETDDFVVIAMTFQDGVMRGYVDGALVGEWSVGGDLSAFESRSFQLGNEATLDRAFDGVLYDVKIWNRSLEPSELEGQADALHVGA